MMKLLVPASLDSSRIDLLIQYIVAIASEQDEFRDRELGPIHVLKYAYLADVAFAKRNEGKTFTGAPWRFHHFGPWALEVFTRIEPALQVVGVEPKRVPSKFSDDALRFGMNRSDADRVREIAEHQLPSAVLFRVQRAVREFGSDTASLLHAVYLTAPMLSAAPEEALVFPGVVRENVVREHAASYSTSGQTSLSKTQQKHMLRHLAEVRAAVQSRLVSRRQNPNVEDPLPRYDEVFASGVRWLEDLAGEVPAERSGSLSVADEVWKSETRREPEIP